MKNTKTVAAIFLGAVVLIGWGAANLLLWEVLAERPIWGAFGFISTALGLPAFGIALWLDFKARR